MFSKKDSPKSRSTTPATCATVTNYMPLTLLDRLKSQRTTKEAQFAVLNQELIELDAQIAGLERAKAFYPQIEQLIESLK